jgi:hypothetical protein
LREKGDIEEHGLAFVAKEQINQITNIGQFGVNLSPLVLPYSRILSMHGGV